MKIERVARNLLGVVALCGLLVSAGCTGTLSSALDSGSSTLPSVNVPTPGDWGSSLLAGGTVGIGMFPAKFTFDVTAAPDCFKDYVAFNTSLVAGAASPSIVAYDNLYSTQPAAGGLCGTAGPSVKWAYRVTSAGNPVTSVVLSGDGTRVAFVESRAAGTGAILHILKWKPGAAAAVQGTLGAPALPDTTMAAGMAWNTTNCPAPNSCIVNITFNNLQAATRSAPFYDYGTDILYVGDDNGVMHKFTGVFLGIPAESCAAGCGVVNANWPITVNVAGTILTSPVFDGVSLNLFVGDSTGRLSFIKEVGSKVGAGTCAVAGVAAPTPCLGTAHVQVGVGGAIVDSPIVDGTTGKVLAVNGKETTNNGTIMQANTDLLTGVTTAALGKIGGNLANTSNIYSGAFDNAYFASGPATGHMYVCGKDPNFNDRPSIYQLMFDAGGTFTALSAPLINLVAASIQACSPVTEFFNPNGAAAGVARDWIFFSFGQHASAGNPIPAGSCRSSGGTGCLMSINVTGEPAWPPTAAAAAALSVAVAVPTNVAGGTSGIVVDNTSTLGQASSIYFSLGTNSTGAGPGLPSCNTTAGVGCAVKLTQLLLN